MKMKTGLILLPLLCAANVAMANGAGKAGAAGPATAAVAPAKTQARMQAHRPGHLPRGDLRRCLDLKSDAAIIRCAETCRKK